MASFFFFNLYRVNIYIFSSKKFFWLISFLVCILVNTFNACVTSINLFKKSIEAIFILIFRFSFTFILFFSIIVHYFSINFFFLLALLASKYLTAILFPFYGRYNSGASNRKLFSLFKNLINNFTICL